MTIIRKNETRTQAEIDEETAKTKAQIAAMESLSVDEQLKIIEKGMLDGSIPISAKITCH